MNTKIKQRLVQVYQAEPTDNLLDFLIRLDENTVEFQPKEVG